MEQKELNERLEKIKQDLKNFEINILNHKNYSKTTLKQ